jgi:hypothetical protein
MVIVTLFPDIKALTRASFVGIFPWSLARALPLAAGKSTDHWWSVPLFVGSAIAIFVV